VHHLDVFTGTVSGNFESVEGHTPYCEVINKQGQGYRLYDAFTAALATFSESRKYHRIKVVYNQGGFAVQEQLYTSFEYLYEDVYCK